MIDQGNSGKELSHINKHGDASMVDVGAKNIQKRRAEATGLIRMSGKTIQAIQRDQVKKGNVLAVARIAGIQAVKATPSLIPLCHTLPIDTIRIDFEFKNERVMATCHVSCQARTGVEMEALTGVSVALLTIYDMCKAIDKEMILDNITLKMKEKEDLES